MVFRDRVDAGRRLAAEIRRRMGPREALVNPLVLGLVRGGVVVAYEVAHALGAPLDIWVVRKIGAPGHDELGLGAIAEGGTTYLNEELLAELDITGEQIADRVAEKAHEVEARVERYRRGRPPPAVEGRTVVLVDDGVATGGTVRAALRAIRLGHPRRLILAVPVGAAHTLDAMRPEADEVVCLEADPYLVSIGSHYDDFEQTTDEEVLDLLDRSRHVAAVAPGPRRGRAPVREAPLAIDVDGGTIEGSLVVPDDALGLVVFAHGSGSSRLSPRNQYVARELQRAGFATLLLDLLTPEEEVLDEEKGHLRFDVELLATRVLAAAEGMRAAPETRALALGLFGASTGAAAALIAAAQRPELVAAIVSRGGRPDLAGGYLRRVTAPTLLVVGGADREVLALNRSALARLAGPGRLSVVPRATHLFEEPGALEQVANLAVAWFRDHLAPRAFEASA